MVDALGSDKGARFLTRDVIGSGPRWICGILEAKAVKCHIELCEDFLRRTRTDSDLDLLLVSAMTMDLRALRRIGRKSRKIAPKALKIVGGPVCTSPERALAASKFDVAIIGEGELALESILAGQSYRRIPGVAYRKASGIVANPSSPLDEINYNKYFPSINLITNYPTYFASRVYVEVVRGCSNFNRTRMELADGRICTRCVEGCGLPECPEGIPPGCGFCSVPSVFGPPKSRKIELVVREIRGLVEVGVRRIVLSAPDILDYYRGLDLRDPKKPRPNYEKLDELLKASVAAADDRAYLSIENVKPSLFDEEAARMIATNLPSCEVHIGCETGDEDHSQALGRPSSPSDAWKAVRIARDHGLKPYVYFIHGLPGQTMGSANKTSRLIRRMGPYVEKITVYRFKPLPGSAFEDEPAGPPRWKDEASNLISNAAKKINLEKKDSYLGRTLEVLAAERNFKRKGEIIGFPTRGGPIVSLSGSKELIGKKLKVKISQVISERLLSGELVEVLSS